ncbi:DUF6789 family protein [Kiloniella sp. b19]|uniref:DUF6789 family protein n=1 Tax=Kiloniella sp. GXU_MW_B19 TaxID=3141326 RepID=UPI0031DEF6CA
MLSALRTDVMRNWVPFAFATTTASIVLEIFARSFARIITGGGPMEPAALLMSLLVLGKDLRWFAELLHYGIGLVAFPVGFIILFRASPLRSMPAALQGVIYGVALWFVALGIMAPLAGIPFMLNFANLTWASLIAHVAYTLVLALMIHRMADRA